MIDPIKYYCIECGKELEVYEFDKCIFCREGDNMNAWKVVMMMETLKKLEKNYLQGLFISLLIWETLLLAQVILKKMLLTPI